MNFFNGVLLGLIEIGANKFRSILTMIGIILGVAALVSMMGMLEGYFRNTQDWIAATGGLEVYKHFFNSLSAERKKELKASGLHEDLKNQMEMEEMIGA